MSGENLVKFLLGTLDRVRDRALGMLGERSWGYCVLRGCYGCFFCCSFWAPFGCFYGCFLVIEARGGTTQYAGSELRVPILVRSRSKCQRQRPDPAVGAVVFTVQGYVYVRPRCVENCQLPGFTVIDFKTIAGQTQAVPKFSTQRFRPLHAPSPGPAVASPVPIAASSAAAPVIRPTGTPVLPGERR